MTNNRNQNERRTEVLKLPTDSAEFVKTLKGERKIAAINPYLSHNRFYQYVRIEKDGKKPEEREESLLSEILQKGTVRENEFCKPSKNEPSELKEILDMLNERNRCITECLSGKRRLYIFKPDDKLICGLGGSSPYGNIQLLRLHHIFGIPYIPASAIKGSIRNYMILEEYNGDEEKAEKTTEFKELFGVRADGVQTEGKLIFFDAFPTRFAMGFDVQTPHFKNYYEGKCQNPLDNEHPVPLFFTCLQNAEFQIYISSSEEVWEKYEQTVDRAVKGVFEDYGLGAKTSLGYGVGRLIKEQAVNRTDGVII